MIAAPGSIKIVTFVLTNTQLDLAPSESNQTGVNSIKRFFKNCYILLRSKTGMELPKFIFQARENLVEKPWGGEWIAMLKGFRQSGIGESWEFSAHPSNPSEVLIRGNVVSMLELFAKAKNDILGDLAAKYAEFPILVKILDISDRISVQVHPSDKVAESLGEGEKGKDEAWMALDSGKVYVGFKEDVEFEVLEKTIEEDREKIFEYLNEFNAAQYDTFTIPAGTIHCAERARLLEVSTNSNVTYRVCDFSGRGEQFDKARKALNTKKTEGYEVKGKRGVIDTDSFAAELVDVSGSVEFEINTFNILFATEGYTILRGENEVADLHKGYSCLIPATTKKYVIEGDRAKVIRIYPK